MSSPSTTRAPEEWRRTNLGQVASCILGGTPSTDVPQYWGGDVPWMASGDVHLRRIEDVPGRITERGLRASNATLTSPPAVAVGLAGQGKTRGTVALTLCTLSTNQSIALLRANGIDLRTDYLFHNLDRRYEELRARSSGGGRGGLSKGILESVPIDLPSLDEQAAIAQVLDTLDAAIHETEALIAKFKAVKQGLLHDLLTRGIDANGELRAPRSEAPQLYRESALGWIPREWDVCALSDCSQISSGVTLGREVSGHGLVELPYLRVANVQDGYLDLSDVKTVRVLRSEIDRFALMYGDVLMNEGGDFDKLGRGTVWRSQIEPCLHQNHVFRVRCDAAQLIPDFLAAYSASQRGKAFFIASSKQSTNLASINSTQLKAFPLVCPSRGEQLKIVERLDAAGRRQSSEESALLKLGRLKAGLMDDLLTGRVLVTPLIDSDGRQHG